jgi:phosphinothricin acetyltransferase
LEEFTARFEKYTQQFPWLVWEEDGEVLGYAYACAPFTRMAYSWVAEASVYLRKDAHRRGIGTALYKALEAILTKQGYLTLYTLVTSENATSLAFHQAVGYEIRADFPRQGFKMGKALGVTWLEKTLKFVDYPQEMPVSVEALVKIDRNFLNNLDRFALS